MAATSGKTQWSAANRLAGSHQLFRPDSVQTLIPRRYRIKKKRRRRQRNGAVAAIRRSTRQRDANPNCLILGSLHVLSHIFLCALFLFFVVFIKPIQRFLIPYLLRVGGMEEALEDVSNEVSNSLHEISCRDIDFTCI